MIAACRERTVAKRNDVSVKIDSDVVANARIAAAVEGITLAEFLSAAAKERSDRVLTAFKAAGGPTLTEKPTGRSK